MTKRSYTGPSKDGFPDLPWKGKGAHEGGKQHGGKQFVLEQGTELTRRQQDRQRMASPASLARVRVNMLVAESMVLSQADL